MKFLLDTHAVIWYIQGDKKLSFNALNIIKNSENKIFFSIVTLWEIIIKINIKKLQLNNDFKLFRNYIEKLNFMKLDLDEKYFDAYLNLLIEVKHRDPFDRMLIAQAITENIPIISADEKFDLYPEIERIW